MEEEAKVSTALGLTKWVHAIYFAGTFIVAWLFVKLIESIWTVANLTFVWAPPPNLAIATVLGGAAAIGLGFYFWKHVTVRRLAMEVVVELSKVVWPTRKELYASTIVVIVFSAIAAIIISMFDFFWAWLTGIPFGRS